MTKLVEAKADQLTLNHDKKATRRILQIESKNETITKRSKNEFSLALFGT